MSNVLVVKLVTGEELLTETSIDANGDVTIKNALLVLPQGQDPQTKQIKFAIVPYISVVDEGTELTIKAQHVLYVGPPQEGVKQYHDKVFGNIMLPPKELVIAR